MDLSPMSQTTRKCILQWIVIGWNAIHACLKEGDYCADISSVHFWHEIIFLFACRPRLYRFDNVSLSW